MDNTKSAATAAARTTVMFTDQDDAQFWGLESNSLFTVLDSKINEWGDVVYLISMIVASESGHADELTWVGAEVLSAY